MKLLKWIYEFLFGVKRDVVRKDTKYEMKAKLPQFTTPKSYPRTSSHNSSLPTSSRRLSGIEYTHILAEEALLANSVVMASMSANISDSNPSSDSGGFSGGFGGGGFSGGGSGGDYGGSSSYDSGGSDSGGGCDGGGGCD